MDNQYFKKIKHDNELKIAFELMQQLRPHLSEVNSFLLQVERQSQQGYQLLGGWQGKCLTGLIGLRESENLLYGRYIYVDDLIVNAQFRHMGIGAALLAQARTTAVQLGCKCLVLDTGLHKLLAQHFYNHQGMLAKGIHFVQQLNLEKHEEFIQKT